MQFLQLVFILFLFIQFYKGTHIQYICCAIRIRKTMHRPKIKISTININKPLLDDDMSPWSKDEEENSCAIVEPILSHRKDIVEKFLNQIKVKGSRKLKKGDSFDRNEYGVKDKKMKSIRDKNSKKSYTEGNISQKDEKQQLEVVRFFREELQKRRKNGLKAKIIDLNLEFDVQSKNYQRQSPSRPKQSFSKKLRQKQEIAIHKSLQREKRNKKVKTESNIFKNPFYLYQFGAIQTSFIKYRSPSQFYRSSATLKRASSAGQKKHKYESQIQQNKSSSKFRRS